MYVWWLIGPINNQSQGIFFFYPLYLNISSTYDNRVDDIHRNALGCCSWFLPNGYQIKWCKWFIVVPNIQWSSRGFIFSGFSFKFQFFWRWLTLQFDLYKQSSLWDDKIWLTIIETFSLIKKSCCEKYLSIGVFRDCSWYHNKTYVNNLTAAVEIDGLITTLIYGLL